MASLAANALAANFTNQESKYISYDWDSEDGLPNDSINAVAQTQEGYFWLATREGLIRFDGVRFVNVPIGSAEKRTTAFTSLYETRDGTIWITSEDGRLFRLKNGKSFEVSLPPVITNGILTRLYEDKLGAIWIGTETNGLVRFSDGQFTRFTTADGLAHNSIRSMCEDDRGSMWIATAGGVSELKDDNFTNLTITNGLLHNSIRVVYFDSHRNLWIASHYGLTRLKDGVMTHYRKRDGLLDNLVSTIYEDHKGVLWIGTFNGLNRMEDGRLFAENRANGTSYDRINSTFEDDEGNLWVGMRNGFSQLKPRVITAYTEQQGLTYNNATSLLEDTDGNLWITFWGGGINKIRDGTITHYTRNSGLSSPLIQTMHQTRSGALWFGMDYDGGLNLFQNGTFIHYRELEGMTDHSVRAIIDDRQGNIWVGTRTALLSFDGQQFHRYTTHDGLPANSIETIHEDRNGRLWFGTDDGLGFLSGDRIISLTRKDGLANNFVASIHEDKDGTLWLGTRGGLSRLRDGKFANFTAQDGLFRDEIYAVTEDDKGFLWMSSRQGIFRVSKKDLNDFAAGKISELVCVSYGKRDGMASIECKGYGAPAVLKDRRGLIWFPTSKGVISVDPTAATINSKPPRVLLESLDVNKEGLDISRSINLTAEKQEFIFRFTAFSFTAPEKIRFKYKLDGLDKDWIDPGELREARYNHLPPGKYRFRVIAANGDGFWNREGQSLALIITPPFWKTWWFASLISVIVVAAVASVVRYISVQKLHRQLAALEQQHAIAKERARIAKDMHDDLGANLTQICVLSELAKREAQMPERIVTHADAISDTARELVQSMDEVVWSANPRNDNLRRLSGYMFQYAERFLAPTQIRGRFEHPVSLPELPLSAEVRHNLFLVVKEALNNAVKHSNASELWLRIGLSNSALEIAIEDNGKGFSQENGRPFGNGLGNMKKRMEDIGAHFETQSAPGAGTKIRIVFTTSNGS